MTISTSEIVILSFLAIVLGIAIWWFVIAYRYGKTLGDFTYSRGANIDLKASEKATIDMKCDPDREICVWRATAICTGEGITNHEQAGVLDPISGGTYKDPNEYGAFNTNTTIDLTQDMAKANGKESYTYTFDSSKLKFKGGVCHNTYSPSTLTGTRPQLIATYACVPKGGKCMTYNPSK